MPKDTSRTEHPWTYPQDIHNPRSLQSYPQDIHRLSTLLYTTKDRAKDRSDPHRPPGSEPNRSEDQSHTDSDDSDIVSSDSDAYSSDPYSVVSAYMWHRIQGVGVLYSIVVESYSVRDQFELQALYCMIGPPYFTVGER